MGVLNNTPSISTFTDADLPEINLMVTEDLMPECPQSNGESHLNGACTLPVTDMDMMKESNGESNLIGKTIGQDEVGGKSNSMMVKTFGQDEAGDDMMVKMVAQDEGITNGHPDTNGSTETNGNTNTKGNVPMVSAAESGPAYDVPDGVDSVSEALPASASETLKPEDKKQQKLFRRNKKKSNEGNVFIHSNKDHVWNCGLLKCLRGRFLQFFWYMVLLHFTLHV